MDPRLSCGWELEAGRPKRRELQPSNIAHQTEENKTLKLLSWARPAVRREQADRVASVHRPRGQVSEQRRVRRENRGWFGGCLKSV